MLEHLADRAPVDVLQEDFVSLGHDENQATRYAKNAARLVDDEMCPLELDGMHGPHESTLRRGMEEEGNREWRRMCKEAEKRVKERKDALSLWGIDSPPSSPLAAPPCPLPGVMLASGFRN
jgi:hypothetical protein